MTNPWSPPKLCVNLSAFAEDLEKRIAEDEENNTCCVCYELFDSVPLNTCCHKLCSKCYDKLDTCPMCRTVYKEKPLDEEFLWECEHGSIRNTPGVNGEFTLCLDGNSSEELRVKLFYRILRRNFSGNRDVEWNPGRLIVSCFGDPHVLICTILEFQEELIVAKFEEQRAAILATRFQWPSSVWS